MNKQAIIAVAIGAALAAGCTRVPNNIGYISDDTLTAGIQPGVDNKDSVQKTLGRPSIASQFDGRSWHYVSRITKQTAFFSPKPQMQQIFTVNFDAAGTVTSVSKRGLEQVASIDPVGDKTPTLGRESGILDDLFGNIGRFGNSTAQGSGNPNSPE